LFLFRRSNCNAMIDSNEGLLNLGRLPLSVLAAAAASAAIVLSQYASPRDSRGSLGDNKYLYSPLLIQEQS
jgi:hypothetical protein